MRQWIAARILDRSVDNLDSHGVRVSERLPPAGVILGKICPDERVDVVIRVQVVIEGQLDNGVIRSSSFESVYVLVELKVGWTSLSTRISDKHLPLVQRHPAKLSF